MWSSIILCSLLPLVLAEDFRIFHRIHNPTAAPTPFSQRGVLTLTSSGPVITASDNLADNLLDFAETAHGLTSALYQVALESDGDEHEGHWSTSSVKAVHYILFLSFHSTAHFVLQCHLSQSTAETFIIHQTHDGKPFSLNYFISPIPHDGSCPKPNSASSPPKYLHSSNTTVLLQSPRLPPRYGYLLCGVSVK